MKIQASARPVFVLVALACSIVASGCSKKDAEPKVAATPSAATKPATATPAPTQPAPAPAPATPRPDPMKSMVDTATKQVDAAAAQVKPVTAPEPTATPQTPAPAQAPSTAMPNNLSTLQDGAAGNTMTSLAASADVLQKQAEELLSKYSGELATLKSGVLAVKSYVDQHQDMLPPTAKTKYQQLNSLMPELDTLVGTLKDYRNVDLTTLVPKLQNDFAKAQSLYAEVRALLPEKL